MYEISDVNRVGRGTNKQRVMCNVNSNYECISMCKGRLQKIKADNIMNLDLRVGRYRSQITMFKRAEIVRRG